MKQLLIYLVAVSLVGIFGGTLSYAASSEEKAAIEAARTWVELVDAGNYAESWNEAASYFQANVSKSSWSQQISGVRGPLGKTLSRSVRSSGYHTSLPGAPDGKYVVIQFDTSFQNKASAIETVTPMYENGEWKVSGYFIR